MMPGAFAAGTLAGCNFDQQGKCIFAQLRDGGRAINEGASID
jgi:hypothetical protein